MFSAWLGTFNKVPHNYSEWKKKKFRKKNNENPDVTSVVGTEPVQLVSWASFANLKLANRTSKHCLKIIFYRFNPVDLPFIWNRAADSRYCLPLKKFRWMNNEEITHLIFFFLSPYFHNLYVSSFKSTASAFFSCFMLHATCLRMLCALLTTAWVFTLSFPWISIKTKQNFANFRIFHQISGMTEHPSIQWIHPSIHSNFSFEVLIL